MADMVPPTRLNAKSSSSPSSVPCKSFFFPRPSSHRTPNSPSAAIAPPCFARSSLAGRRCALLPSAISSRRRDAGATAIVDLQYTPNTDAPSGNNTYTGARGATGRIYHDKTALRRTRTATRTRSEWTC